MKAELDLSFLSQNLFTGPEGAEILLDRIKGDGYLLIKVNDAQVVTSSFMFGLLKSHRFQGLAVSGTSHNDLHESEVIRALERYSRWDSRPKDGSIQRYSLTLRGVKENSAGDWVSYNDHLHIVNGLNQKIAGLQKKVSDASWEADVKREEAEQRRHQEWR